MYVCFQNGAKVAFVLRKEVIILAFVLWFRFSLLPKVEQSEAWFPCGDGR